MNTRARRLGLMIVVLAAALWLTRLGASASSAASDEGSISLGDVVRRHLWGSTRSMSERPSEIDPVREAIARRDRETPTSLEHRWAPSPVSHTPASIRIDNTCDETLVVSWIDFEGAERECVQLRPDHFWEQPSWEGHEWIVRALDSDRVLARFASSDGDVVVPCADGSPARAAATSREDAPPASCPICSPRSTTESGFTIENRCATSIHVVWRSFDGAARQYGSIAPGAVRTQSSYVGHRWEISDDDGTIVAHHVVAEDGAHVVACL